VRVGPKRWNQRILTLCWFLWVKQPALGYVALNNLRWIGRGMQMFIFTRNRVRPTRLTWSNISLVIDFIAVGRDCYRVIRRSLYDVIYCSAGIRQQKCNRRATAAGPSHISLAIRSGRPNLVAFHDLQRRPPGPLVDSNFSPKNRNFQRSTPATSLLPTLPGEIRYCVLVLSSNKVVWPIKKSKFSLKLRLQSYAQPNSFKSDGNLPSFSVGRKHRFGVRH